MIIQNKHVRKQLPFLRKEFFNGFKKHSNIRFTTVKEKEKISIFNTIVGQLSEIDPSDNCCNLHTFCTWIANGTMIWAEDRIKLETAINDYQIAKAKYPQLTAISKFKSLQELTKMIDKLLYPEKLREENKGIRIKELLNMNGVKALYFEKADAILEITDPETMAKLSKGTKWCVSDPKIAQEYLDNNCYDDEISPFYLLIQKGKKHSLWNLGNHQVRDIHDEILPLWDYDTDALVDNILVQEMFDRFNEEVMHIMGNQAVQGY